MADALASGEEPAGRTPKRGGRAARRGRARGMEALEEEGSGALDREPGARGREPPPIERGLETRTESPLAPRRLADLGRMIDSGPGRNGRRRPRVVCSRRATARRARNGSRPRPRRRARAVGGDAPGRDAGARAALPRASRRRGRPRGSTMRLALLALLLALVPASRARAQAPPSAREEPGAAWTRLRAAWDPAKDDVTLLSGPPARLPARDLPRFHAFLDSLATRDAAGPNALRYWGAVGLQLGVDPDSVARRFARSMLPETGVMEVGEMVRVLEAFEAEEAALSLLDRAAEAGIPTQRLALVRGQLEARAGDREGAVGSWLLALGAGGDEAVAAAARIGDLAADGGGLPAGTVERLASLRGVAVDDASATHGGAARANPCLGGAMEEALAAATDPALDSVARGALRDVAATARARPRSPPATHSSSSWPWVHPPRSPRTGSRWGRSKTSWENRPPPRRASRRRARRGHGRAGSRARGQGPGSPRERRRGADRGRDRGGHRRWSGSRGGRGPEGRSLPVPRAGRQRARLVRGRDRGGTGRRGRSRGALARASRAGAPPRGDPPTRPGGDRRRARPRAFGPAGRVGAAVGARRAGGVADTPESRDRSSSRLRGVARSRGDLAGATRRRRRARDPGSWWVPRSFRRRPLGVDARHRSARRLWRSWPRITGRRRTLDARCRLAADRERRSSCARWRVRVPPPSRDPSPSPDSRSRRGRRPAAPPRPPPS
jgi:hypothetical protein